jgi:ethanolamine utilization protein EutQ (cupin superfamily)
MAKNWPLRGFFEWELREGELSDPHPHDEFNFVLEDELHVECDGALFVAGFGDMVTVRPTGLEPTGTDDARMFAAHA